MTSIEIARAVMPKYSTNYQTRRPPRALDTVPKWSYPYGAGFGLVPRYEAPPLNSGASGREG
jgi:hypothetical protein